MAKLRSLQRGSRLNAVADERSRAQTSGAAQGGNTARAIGALGGAITNAAMTGLSLENQERDQQFRLDSQKADADAQFDRQQLAFEQRELKKSEDAKSNAIIVNAGYTINTVANNHRRDREAGRFKSQEDDRNGWASSMQQILETIPEDSPEAKLSVQALLNKHGAQLDNERTSSEIRRNAEETLAVVDEAERSFVDFSADGSILDPEGSYSQAYDIAALKNGGLLVSESDMWTPGQHAMVSRDTERILGTAIGETLKRTYEAKGALAFEGQAKLLATKYPEFADEIATMEKKMEPAVAQETVQLSIDVVAANMDADVKEGKYKTAGEFEADAKAAGVSPKLMSSVVGGLVNKQAEAIRTYDTVVKRVRGAVARDASLGLAEVVKLNTEQLSRVRSGDAQGLERAVDLPTRIQGQESANIGALDYWRETHTKAAFASGLPQYEIDAQVQNLNEAYAMARGQKVFFDPKGNPIAGVAQKLYDNETINGYMQRVASAEYEAATDYLNSRSMLTSDDTYNTLSKMQEGKGDLQIVKDHVDKLPGATVLSPTAKRLAKVNNIAIDERAAKSAAYAYAADLAKEYNNETPVEKRTRSGLDAYLSKGFTSLKIESGSWSKKILGEDKQSLSPFEASLLRDGGMTDQVNITGDDQNRIIASAGFVGTSAKVLFLPEDMKGAGRLGVQIPTSEVTHDNLRKAGWSDARIKKFDEDVETWGEYIAGAYTSVAVRMSPLAVLRTFGYDAGEKALAATGLGGAKSRNMIFSEDGTRVLFEPITTGIGGE